jgi:hypothetical protein
VTKGRLERRQELRRLRRNRPHHRSESEAESPGVLEWQDRPSNGYSAEGSHDASAEPIWVVFVTIVLVGCVLLAVRAFRRRRR